MGRQVAGGQALVAEGITGVVHSQHKEVTLHVEVLLEAKSLHTFNID